MKGIIGKRENDLGIDVGWKHVSVDKGLNYV